MIVGTPGRVLDIFNRNRMLVLKELEVLVLDEADTLLDMGFRQTINQVYHVLEIILTMVDIIHASETKANRTFFCNSNSRIT